MPLGGRVLDPRALTSLPQWKSFDFFDVAQINLPTDEVQQLFESNEISSVATGSDSLFIGSHDGWVSIISKTWNVLRRFQAHDIGSITHMRQVEGTSVLVTVAVSRAVMLPAVENLYMCSGSDMVAGGPKQ